MNERFEIIGLFILVGLFVFMCLYLTFGGL